MSVQITYSSDKENILFSIKSCDLIKVLSKFLNTFKFIDMETFGPNANNTRHATVELIEIKLEKVVHKLKTLKKAHLDLMALGTMNFDYSIPKDTY